jgi:hypothetical protein
MNSAFIIASVIVVLILICIFIIRHKQKKTQTEDHQDAFPVSDASLPEGDVRKVAFCFLLKNDFPTESIWQAYFDKIPNEDVKIIIHGKPNVQLKTPLAHKATIVPPLETRWGHVSLVKAQTAMLREALKDESVDRICILSGQCIPLRSLNDLVHRLNKNPKSMFTLYDQRNRFPRFNALKKHMPQEHIAFHQQWCVLLRRHATMLANNEARYIKWFDNLHAPDECTYLTMLKHYGEYNHLSSRSGGFESVTFTHWHDIPYKFKSPDDPLTSSHPKTYDVITHEELQYLMSSPSILFARKFHRNCIVTYPDKKTFKPLLDALIEEGIIAASSQKGNVYFPSQIAKALA